MSGIHRRDFLIGAFGLSLLGCSQQQKKMNGELLNPDMSVGHRLREGHFPEPSHEIHMPVAILGGGVAGLSCAWWLKRNHFSDFSIFELESAVGGNARSGKNAVGQFPWGAHYLPIPNAEAEYVRILLAELGVIQSENKIPVYDQRYLVHAPNERLFIHGRWQEGLLPKYGVGASALNELEKFEQLMRDYTEKKGRDGLMAFAIPSAFSSQDEEFLQLDKMSFYQWLVQKGFHSDALHWYVSYSCRDDYGVNHQHISAWAGLHYFCARRGYAANAETNSVLTWPEGNSWLIEKLRQPLSSQIHTQHAAINIQTTAKKVMTDLWDSRRQQVVRIISDKIVWAAPEFILPYVWKKMPSVNHPEYAPWLVANLTIEQADEHEFSTWDNVIYQGKGLGYVDSSHQLLAHRKPQRVLTYYRPLDHKTPSEGRQLLLQKSHEYWADSIFQELSQAHPHLQSKTLQMDIWRWPHAMPIPAPGFLHQRQQRQQTVDPKILRAHSDLSGFSIFEEAQYWGVKAAQALLMA